MRFMIIRKADAMTESEADASPPAALIDAMAAYNMEMVEAGIFRGGDGLQPSRKGARVQIARDGAAPTVTDGPFAETKELIAGFTMIEAGSFAEALDWVKRWPKEDGPVTLELRQVYELADLGIEGDQAEVWNEIKSGAEETAR